MVSSGPKSVAGRCGTVEADNICRLVGRHGCLSELHDIHFSSMLLRSHAGDPTRVHTRFRRNGSSLFGHTRCCILLSSVGTRDRTSPSGGRLGGLLRSTDHETLGCAHCSGSSGF